MFKTYTIYKKNNFLLLELMIGLAIVVMCLVPLALSPYLRSKALVNSLVELELEKEAAIIAAAYKENLYKQKIRPKDIKKERITLSSTPFEKKKFILKLPELVEKKYDLKTYLSLYKGKKHPPDYHYLVKLVVVFTLEGKKVARKDPHFEYLFAMTENSHVMVQKEEIEQSKD